MSHDAQPSLWETPEEPTTPTTPVKKLTSRQWLFEWGKRHSFPEVEFLIGSGTMGDFRGGVILKGEGHWRLLLDWPGEIDTLWLHKAIAHAQAQESETAG